MSSLTREQWAAHARQAVAETAAELGRLQQRISDRQAELDEDERDEATLEFRLKALRVRLAELEAAQS
jgi:chromosome segregation ATPase